MAEEMEKVIIKPKISGGNLYCNIKINDSKLIGKKADIKLFQVVFIKGHPIDNKTKEIYNNSFITKGDNNFKIDIKINDNYCYLGKKIDIKYKIDIKINESFVHKVYKNKEFGFNLAKYENYDNSINTKEIIEKEDYFDFVHNLKVIPLENRIEAIILCIIGVILIGINSMIGIHDQISTEQKVIFYKHKNSKGESSSPFLDSLLLSGGLGLVIRRMIKSNLKTYMSFYLKNENICFEKDKEYFLRNILEGKTKIPLKDIELKIVACNIEKGMYTSGSGKNKRIIKINEYFNGIILHSEKISYIPKGSNISEYISGSIYLNAIYEKLLPELMIGDSHGVGLHFEIQLIDDNLVDQELTIASKYFDKKYFLLYQSSSHNKDKT